MTKITGIPRMIGMTGDLDAKRTSMTGLTGINYNHGQKSLGQ